MAGAYRLPAPLNRLSFNDGQVKVEARKQTLTLTPVDFIAKLTFDRNVADDGLAYAQPEDATTGDDGGFNQTVPENKPLGSGFGN